MNFGTVNDRNAMLENDTMNRSKFCVAVVAFFAVASCSLIGCSKTDHNYLGGFDPAQILRDQKIPLESVGEKKETRNADGSVDVEWKGTVLLGSTNDLETLPDLWRSAIGRILGANPDADFPSSTQRKAGEPFDGRLSWQYDGIFDQMHIALQPNENGKSASYTVSIHGTLVKK